MSDLLEKAKAQSWYHTLELPGLETPGLFDMRPYVDTYRLPASLAGLRVLEVGTWDGFWAFEMERRGAAEVVALDLDDERDLDWPPRARDFNADNVRGEGFRVASELLESRVERVVCSVYDAVPADLGEFDLVLCGSVLIHLRDQLLALERIAGLVRPGGTFITAEGYSRALGPLPVARFRGNRTGSVVFWEPSRRAWRDMLWYAGFDTVQEVARFTMRSTAGWKIRHVVHHASK